MISCFFDRNLRKVRSFVGSRSRMTLRALAAMAVMCDAYEVVCGTSKRRTVSIPRFHATGGGATFPRLPARESRPGPGRQKSARRFQRGGRWPAVRTNAGSRVLRIGTPSTLTMRMPCTPLCELMRLRVSSTSDCARSRARSRSARRRRDINQTCDESAARNGRKRRRFLNPWRGLGALRARGGRRQSPPDAGAARRAGWQPKAGRRTMAKLAALRSLVFQPSGVMSPSSSARSAGSIG